MSFSIYRSVSRSHTFRINDWPRSKRLELCPYSQQKDRMSWLARMEQPILIKLGVHESPEAVRLEWIVAG